MSSSLLQRPILALESSCDDFSAAVVHQGKLCSHVIRSQSIHATYGGVVPELAAREHHMHMVPIIKQALREAKSSLKDMGSLAVTQGPGLLGSLLVSTSFANGLAISLGLPLMGVHHMQAHLLANFLTPPYPAFPFLGLTLSGGHTQLIEVKDFFTMKLLGTTQDDAIGEAFDKGAKMMGLSYPGGHQVDALAQKGNPDRFPFPVASMGGYDFSFSGVKTAVRYLIEKEVQKDAQFVEKNRADICASLQKALVKAIEKKVEKAFRETPCKTLVLGGGVANNSGLQKALKSLCEKYGADFFVPAPLFTTDNAAMIGITAYYALKKQRKTATFLEPLPRWPLEEMIAFG